MNFGLKCMAAFFALTLSGCADFKGVPPLDVMLSKTFQQIPSATAPKKLQKDWWRHTNDETLKNIITQIETQNLSLEQARFRLNAAREDSRSQDFLPNVTIGSDAQYSHSIKGQSVNPNVGVPQSSGKKTTGYYNVKIDSSWEVPIYGQYADARDIADANIAFAEADIESVRASVISEAIRLYAQMRAKQREIILREDIRASSQKISNYQSIKHNVGLITDTELGTSKQSELSAQNDVQIAKSELVVLQQQLSKLLGNVKPDPAWNVATDIPKFDLPVFDDTPLDVLRNRPDIRKAEASVMVAAGDFELAKSEMYPKLTLSGTLSQLDNINGSPLAGRVVELTGVPSISLPLFDWGKRLANAKAKDEKLSETASAYRETVIGAMNEVEEFWSQYRTAQATEITAKQSAEISSKAGQQAALLFKQGISDGIQKENAQIDMSRNAIAYLQSRADTITTLTTLTKALGGVGNTTYGEK